MDLDEIIAKEMQQNIYELYVKIDDGDIFVDLGCSKGCNYFKHKNRNIHYIGVDADVYVLSDFIQQLKHADKPILINSMLMEERGIHQFTSFFYNNRSSVVNSITFKDLVNLVGKRIDFLKFDIEGFEHCLFIDIEYFKQNVRKFAGEIHLNSADVEKQKILQMLETIRDDKQIKHKLYSVDGVDITDYFWQHIDYYREILIGGFVVDKVSPFLESYSTTVKQNKTIERIQYHFINGPFVEIYCSKPRQYLVKIKDGEQIIHQAELGNNHWTKAYRTYHTDWTLEVFESGKLKLNHQFCCKDKRVFIAFDSSSIGDTIAWIPYVEEFRKKHQCKLICSTFHNQLFKQSYPDIDFVEPGSTVDNIYCQFTLGIFLNDEPNRHPNNWRTIPLQQVAADILGLDYKEIKPTLDIKCQERPIKEKYVVIGPQSTSKCKEWNNPTGWQEVVDYCNKNGLKVISLRQSGKSNLKHVEEYSNKNIHQVIQFLSHCEFFVGLGSGLSWLAWALGRTVVLISGFSQPFCEFSTPHRIINKDVCHGCFNDIRYTFDRSDWNWCPRKKDFECTKNITSIDVIQSVKQSLL